MRSSELGSAHCKSSKASTIGCDRAAGQDPGRYRRQLPATQFFRRILRLLEAPVCGPAARTLAARIRLGRARPAAAYSRDRQAACSSDASAPRTAGGPIRRSDAAGYFAITARRPFHPGVRRLPELGTKLLDQSRLPDARLAGDEHKLAFACARPLPAPTQQSELFLATDEWRQQARAAAPTAAACANDPIEATGSGTPLSHARLLLSDEQPRDLALDVCGDDHRPRFGRRLHPRSDVRRLAEHFARRVDHDRSGF